MIEGGHFQELATLQESIDKIFSYSVVVRLDVNFKPARPEVLNVNQCDIALWIALPIVVTQFYTSQSFYGSETSTTICSLRLILGAF
jgi:hypothetical protein